MRFIKSFFPFVFITVIFAFMITHLGDNTYFMPCLFGIVGWLEYLDLRYKVGKGA